MSKIHYLFTLSTLNRDVISFKDGTFIKVINMPPKSFDALLAFLKKNAISHKTYEWVNLEIYTLEK